MKRKRQAATFIGTYFHNQARTVKLLIYMAFLKGEAGVRLLHETIRGMYLTALEDFERQELERMSRNIKSI